MVAEFAYLRRVKPKLRKHLARPQAPTTGGSPSTSTSTTSTFTSTSEPVRFKVNVVVPATADRVGRFVRAGDPSPFHDVIQVPEGLRPFIASNKDEPDPEHDDEPQNVVFALNPQYAVGEDGRRGRRLQREVIRLEQQAETQAYWEERVGQLTEQERAALAIAQEDHEIAVARDTAIATAGARERDLSAERAMRSIDEDQNDADSDYFVSPSIQTL